MEGTLSSLIIVKLNLPESKALPCYEFQRLSFNLLFVIETFTVSITNHGFDKHDLLKTCLSKPDSKSCKYNVHMIILHY